MAIHGVLSRSALLPNEPYGRRAAVLSCRLAFAPDVSPTRPVPCDSLDNRGWRLSFEADVRQSEFGVKTYSLLMGSIKVVDDVTVSVTVGRAKDD